jgi:hypothetical protein
MIEKNATVRNKITFKEFTLTFVCASALGLVAVGLMWLLSGLLISLLYLGK